MVMKNINEMVQDLISFGMTQKQIASAIGVSQAVVSDIYRGKQKDIGYVRGGKSLEQLYLSRTVETVTN
jgi:predicted XRE-type DNA-binding protein